MLRRKAQSQLVPYVVCTLVGGLATLTVVERDQWMSILGFSTPAAVAETVADEESNDDTVSSVNGLSDEDSGDANTPPALMPVSSTELVTTDQAHVVLRPTEEPAPTVESSSEEADDSERLESLATEFEDLGNQLKRIRETVDVALP